MLVKVNWVKVKLVVMRLAKLSCMSNKMKMYCACNPTRVATVPTPVSVVSSGTAMYTSLEES